VRLVQPRAKLLQVSARSGEGLAAWLDWLTAQVRALD